MTIQDIVYLLDSFGIPGLIFVVGFFMLREMKKDIKDIKAAQQVQSAELKTLASKLGDIFSKTQAFTAVVTYALKLKDDPFAGSNFFSDSPVNLTERGTDVAIKLKAMDTAKEYLPKLLEMVPQEPTSYEVQQVCFDYVLGNFLNEANKALKTKIHDEAFEDKGNLHNVLMVYAIVFRNLVMKEKGMDYPSVSAKLKI